MAAHVEANPIPCAHGDAEGGDEKEEARVHDTNELKHPEEPR